MTISKLRTDQHFQHFTYANTQLHICNEAKTRKAFYFSAGIKTF